MTTIEEKTFRTDAAGGDERVRVLIVDDHKVVRSGLSDELPPTRFEVVGEAASGRDALSAVAQLRPDIVLLDLNLPDLSGPVVLEELRQIAPEARVIVFSAYGDESLVRAAAEAGARAYLLKDAEELDLAGTIERVLTGDSVIDPRAAGALLRTLGPDGAPAEPELTRQERRILQLVAEGYTNREIGERLYLSRHTVKEYLSNVMRKFDVATRVEAVLEGGRRGLVGLNLSKSDRERPGA
jgi:DNA-binding NarL/FixJ family response regulator